jgi:hypothetical protein
LYFFFVVVLLATGAKIGIGITITFLIFCMLGFCVYKYRKAKTNEHNHINYERSIELNDTDDIVSSTNVQSNESSNLQNYEPPKMTENLIIHSENSDTIDTL